MNNELLIAATPSQLTTPAVKAAPRRLRVVASPELAPTRPAVLLALFDGEQPTASLLRASALARVLGADLQVLHVLRPLQVGARVNPLFPQRNAGDALGGLARLQTLSEATVAWVRASLGDFDDDAHLAHACGEFFDEVEAHARRLGAQLIVLAPGEGRLGGAVTGLACAAGVPVLVARAAGAAETIVAATDLQRTDYPVLRRAAELGRQLEAPVVAVHSLAAEPLLGGVELAWAAQASPLEPLRAARVERLTHVARKLAVHAEPVVHLEHSPAEAILREARAQEADLVVVGTRRRNWLERWMTSSVAEEVVDRARRSVLVLPVLDEEAAGAPLA